MPTPAWETFSSAISRLLWRVQARDFVKARWDAIQRVAAALLKQQTLDAEQVRRLVFTMTAQP